MREHQQAFSAEGASLAAIGMGDRAYASYFQEETGITFPLLIDQEREAYQIMGLRSANVLHLLRPDNAISQIRAKAGGHSQKRLGQNPFQLGGSFVFVPGNRAVFAHISQTFGDNATPGALLDAVRRSRDWAKGA